MAMASVHTILARVPPTPRFAKWTKLGPSLDFLLQGGSQGILDSIMHAASREFTYPQGQGPVTNLVANADDLPELSWHQLAGGKISAAWKCLWKCLT